jgi:hypothetical protein
MRSASGLRCCAADFGLGSPRPDSSRSYGRTLIADNMVGTPYFVCKLKRTKSDRVPQQNEQNNDPFC